MNHATRRWRSPNTGRLLHHDTPHSLTDGQFERWPVVDGIPYLRVESEGLVARALHELDSGAPDRALVALLTDQDAWWTGPATDLDDLTRLVARRDTLTLREAMALLRLGPVADYFAYRWGDPTYLAGLALLEAHWHAPATAFELACGIGHYLRELTRRGVRCLGADVVFAKCWLARHWVAPHADYVVFDAGATWPLGGGVEEGGGGFDLVHCQDAFYFLPRQDAVAAALRAATATGGQMAIGHVHNADYRDGAKGPARAAAEWRALFPDAAVYDERVLLGALLEGAAPRPCGWAQDTAIEAWSLVEGGGAPRPLAGGLALPVDGADLCRNPLLHDGGPHWPSDRYRDEYAALSPWAAPPYPAAPERDRRLVDLPARW